MHTAFAGLLRHAKPDHTLSDVAMVGMGSALATDERREGGPRLRTGVAGLLGDSAVAQIQITTLLSASSTWGRAWDDLIAIALRDGALAGAAVTSGACADLLGELRQLGMQPNVVVATDACTVVLAEAQS